MTFEIRVADELTEAERRALFGWSENVFGVEDGLYSWRPKERHIVVEAEGRAISHVGLLLDTVRAGEESVEVAGVGAVVTVPEVQGKGYSQLAMRRALSVARDEMEVDFGMLFCLERLVPFYAKQGWRLVEDECVVEQGCERVRFPFRVMVFQLGEREWPAGRIETSGLPW